MKTLYTLLSCIEHLFWIKFNDFYPNTCLLLNCDCSFLNSGWFQNLHCYKPIRMFTIGWAVYIFSYPINHFCAMFEFKQIHQKVFRIIKRWVFFYLQNDDCRHNELLISYIYFGSNGNKHLCVVWFGSVSITWYRASQSIWTDEPDSGRAIILS